MREMASLTRLLREGVETGAFPGAAAAVFGLETCLHESARGVRWLDGPPVEVATRFDLASLTKVLATLPALLLLVDAGEVRLDDRVTRFWPAFGARGKGEVTLRMLLAHASGLPAWKPFFLDVLRHEAGRVLMAAKGGRTRQALELAVALGRDAVLRGVAGAELERGPWQRAVYSDLGFIALGEVVARVSGTRFDAFVRDEVHARLDLAGEFSFMPPEAEDGDGGQSGDAAVQGEATNIAATGLFRPREPAPGQEALVPAPTGTPPEARVGEVDDDNAFVMGGVAGHAGLFGSARGVGLFGERVLEEMEGAHRLASVALWQEVTRRDPRTPGSTRALGFDTPSLTGSSAGGRIAASRAVGHTGFTGTSLWIDLDRQIAVALLTNRVHPRRGNEAIRDFRPRFHEAAMEALEVEVSGGPKGGGAVQGTTGTLNRG